MFSTDTHRRGAALAPLSLAPSFVDIGVFRAIRCSCGPLCLPSGRDPAPKPPRSTEGKYRSVTPLCFLGGQENNCVATILSSIQFFTRAKRSEVFFTIPKRVCNILVCTSNSGAASFHSCAFTARLTIGCRYVLMFFHSSN